MWYELDITPDGDVWLVTSPDFGELVSFGETIPLACANGRNAIEEAIAARMAHGEDLPRPTMEPAGQYAVQMPVLVRMKSAIYMILRSRGLTRADLQRMMKLPHREQVDRLLRLDHKTDIETLMAAFECLDVKVEMTIPFPAAA
jgi:antitoxin HicB